LSCIDNVGQLLISELHDGSNIAVFVSTNKHSRSLLLQLLSETCSFLGTIGQFSFHLVHTDAGRDL